MEKLESVPLRHRSRRGARAPTADAAPAAVRGPISRELSRLSVWLSNARALPGAVGEAPAGGDLVPTLRPRRPGSGVGAGPQALGVAPHGGPGRPGGRPGGAPARGDARDPRTPGPAPVAPSGSLRAAHGAPQPGSPRSGGAGSGGDGVSRAGA